MVGGWRKGIGWCVAQGFRMLGARARALRRYDAPGTVLSLCAHDPTPEVLSGVLRWLKAQGFAFLSADDVLSGATGAGRHAWLSFDDGWKGFRACLPILEAEHVPATLFIAPGEIQRGFLWSNALMPFCTMREIRAYYRIPAEERTQKVRELVGATQERTLLSEEEVKTLAKHPLITLGNHSLSHLSCSDRPLEEVVREIREAQAILTQWADGRAPRLFGYPFGHWTAQTDHAVRELGLIPVKLFPGVDRVETFGTYRNMIYDTMSLAENTCRVLKAWLPIRRT